MRVLKEGAYGRSFFMTINPCLSGNKQDRHQTGDRSIYWKYPVFQLGGVRLV